MSTLPIVRVPFPHAHGLGSLLWRNAGFVLLVTGGAVLRVLAMLGFPPILWFTGDSYLYLTRTLRLTPSPSKTMGYPFLLKLLQPFHSLTLVAAVQHLMGLAIAVMIYALLRRARLPRWAAAALTVPVLYDAYQIELEQLLMAETLFTFLIMSAMTLMLWTGRRPAWSASAAGLTAGLLLGWAVLVRSAGAGALPVLLGCLVVRQVGWRACAAATAGCVLPLAGYAMWFHAHQGGYGLTSADGLYLWGRTTTFATCEKLDLPPEERGLCLKGPADGREAPGTIIWRKEAPPRRLPGGPITPDNNRLLRSFSIHAIESQPADYLSSVAAGIGMAVGPHRLRYPNPSTEALYHFPGRPHRFPPNRLLTGQLPGDAAHAYGRQNPSRVVEPWAGFLRAYQSRAFLPGPVLGLLFVVGAAGLFRRAGRAHRGAVLTAWSASVALLVFPIAVADFDYRYVLPVVPFTCLAAGLALAPRRRTAPAAPDPEPDPEPEAGADAEDEAAPPEQVRRGREVARAISRWWGSRGSLRRDSGRASAP
ncbi:phospholipid carrier-dependent glycosyltransferase [Actinomadura scrupuli]|uniref:phospholipid carrier-dependent glycosyltransferase n=1 Tax=Actinomadura scrupuli TaxID=559629 RepID=UPI003D9565E9